jgi:23S rRNA pseudouridine1911/1915/1917 synthase
MTTETIEVIEETAQIPEHLAQKRLDQVVATLWPQFSRSQLKQWILRGELLLDDQTAKPKSKVQALQQLSLKACLQQQGNWQAQAMDLPIVFEDDDLLVINKGAGLVVHPGAGNPDSTLLNGLLHHCPQLKNLPRAGIVHRIDKNTTGLLVIAKTLNSYHALIKNMQERSISRRYLALVQGDIIAGSTIDEPIGRHPRKRTQMAVHHNGKSAITHYRVKEKISCYTLLNIRLETGRTHQIRVHMAHIRHPIIGDPEYGKRPILPKQASSKLIEAIQQFSRQALHACELSLTHPRKQELLTLTAPLPEDMQTLLDTLRKEQ